MRISKDLGENYSMHSVDYTLSYKGRWHVSIPQIGTDIYVNRKCKCDHHLVNLKLNYQLIASQPQLIIVNDQEPN